MTPTSATRTETNREIIRQAFDAWRQGTGAITDVFAPDMVWRIEGHSAASKEYRSKQQFIDEVLAPFGARFTTSEPFRPVTIRRSTPTRTPSSSSGTAAGPPSTVSPTRTATPGS
jgi:ketosteroid isomerase-like protein